jgi:hypothetical protein
MGLVSVVSRADMEQLCGHLFQRVEKTLRKCLEDSSEYISIDFIPMYVYNTFLIWSLRYRFKQL